MKNAIVLLKLGEYLLLFATSALFLFLFINAIF